MKKKVMREPLLTADLIRIWCMHGRIQRGGGARGALALQNL